MVLRFAGAAVAAALAVYHLVILGTGHRGLTGGL